MPPIMYIQIVCSDGHIYQYRVDEFEGGDCRLLREASLISTASEELGSAVFT